MKNPYSKPNWIQSRSNLYFDTDKWRYLQVYLGSGGFGFGSKRIKVEDGWRGFAEGLDTELRALVGYCNRNTNSHKKVVQ